MTDLPYVDSMASTLALSDIDLGDERAVMRLLQAERFSEGDIVAWSDEATDRARELRQAAAPISNALACVATALMLTLIWCVPVLAADGQSFADHSLRTALIVAGTLGFAGIILAMIRRLPTLTAAERIYANDNEPR